ncbi:MAG: hypothetical protein HYT83_01110 [Candidatus Levybacteria bacterium]|nr:hypothetical protein [Candidatus Levybacteria bacterium]
MSETGDTDIRSESHHARAKEFLNALPVGGVILHGTVARNAENIKKEGLGNTSSARSARVDYFSFQPSQDISLGNLSAKELRETRQRFVKSLEENIFWSEAHGSLRPFYDDSWSDFPDEFKMDNLPAVVVAKRPDNILEVVKKNDKTGFAWETSGPIPPEDILMVASLSKEEFDKLKATMSGSVPDISGYDANPEIQKRVEALKDEARSKMARILAGKILSQLLTIQRQ